MQEGKPNKKMYFITDAGREEFYQYMQTDVEKDVLRSDFLMRMYFGNYSDDKAIKKWIEDEIERKEAYIADLRLKYEKVEKRYYFCRGNFTRCRYCIL